MNNAKLYSLQAGRGIAAILVVFYHASSTIFHNPKFFPDTIFNNFFNFGHSGVIFFFVLSGFIILSAHLTDIGRPDRLRNYTFKRFVRVYPVYWTIIFPISIVYFLRPEISNPELTSHSVIANSFLLFGSNSRASLAVAWTLFHEILFYAAFAVLILHRSIGTIIMTGWFLSCGIAAVLGFDTSYHLSYMNLFFLLGMACFVITSRTSIKNPMPIAILGIMAFFGVGMIEVFGPAVAPQLLAIGYGLSAAVGIVGVVTYEKGRNIRFPTWVTLVGDASYSIYLVHYPALSVITRIWIKIFGNDRFPAAINFVAIVGAAVIAGVIFHIVVEKPLISLIYKMQSRFRQAPVMV